ncbi:Nuclear transport factor 2, partial [Elasticomyces elasticus]
YGYVPPARTPLVNWKEKTLTFAKSLPFKDVKHQVASVDAQPSSESGGILVLVAGALIVDEEQKPMSYTQAFQLLPDGQGSYFVFNDVFRLVYPAA